MKVAWVWLGLLAMALFSAAWSQKPLCFADLRKLTPCEPYAFSGKPCLDHEGRDCFCANATSSETLRCGPHSFNCFYRTRSGRRTNQRCFEFDAQERCFAGRNRICDDNAGSVCRSGLSGGSVFDGNTCSCLRDSDREPCDNGDNNCFWYPMTPGLLPHNLTNTNQSCYFKECFQKDDGSECPEYFPPDENCTTKSQEQCFCGNPSDQGDHKCQENDFNCVHMFKTEEGVSKETATKKHCFIKKYNPIELCYQDKKNELFCGVNASETCWDISGKSKCTCTCADSGCFWNYKDESKKKIVITKMKCSFDKKLQCFGKDGFFCGKDAGNWCQGGKNATTILGGPTCQCKSRNGQPCQAKDGSDCSWHVGNRKTHAINTNIDSNTGQPCRFVEHRCLTVRWEGIQGKEDCAIDENPLRCMDSKNEQCSCRLLFKGKPHTNISCPEDPSKWKGAACLWHDSTGYPTKHPCSPARQQCYEHWGTGEKCGVSKKAVCFTGFRAEGDAGCACLEVKRKKEATPCYRNSTECAWYYQSSVYGSFIQTHPKQKCRPVDKMCVEQLPHMKLDNWDDYEKQRCSYRTQEEPGKACRSNALAKPCSCRQAKDPSKLCISNADYCFWAYPHPNGKRHLLSSSNCYPPIIPCLRLDSPKEDCRPNEAPTNCPRCECKDGFWHHYALGATKMPCTLHPVHQEP